MLERGLVQIYTGNGKGKTTAALGLALRAAGRENKVLFYQFLKPPSLTLGERMALDSTDLPIEVEALDVEWDMTESLKNKQTVALARDRITKALRQLTQYAQERAYDLIILDEILVCLTENLTRTDDLNTLIDRKHRMVELILTGRGATKELIKKADLVTEMRNIKHPFEKGVEARPGIEY